jgi:signal recognition particle subunit SRP54
MEPSSRTPEGEPNRCPVCGKAVRIDPSRPPGDAPCPHCGHLLWFGSPEEDVTQWEATNPENGTRQQARFLQGALTLDDFKKLLRQTRVLGPLNKIVSMLPGMGGMSQTLAELDADKDVRRLTGIIDAMTPGERRSPSDTLDESRQRRVAKGAGVTQGDVSDLVKQYEGMAEMMRRMAEMGIHDRARLMAQLARHRRMGSG